MPYLKNKDTGETEGFIEESWWGLLVFALILSALGGFILWLSVVNQPSVPPPATEKALEQLTAPHSPPLKHHKTIYAPTTEYTKIETCLRTQCRTADGGLPEKDKTAACPRSILLGSTVQIGRVYYRCTDRTNKKFDGRFDIYHGATQDDYQEAVRYGIQVKEVTIL